MHAYVQTENAPTPKPSWWRSMYLVMQGGQEIARYRTWGAASVHARTLNAGHAVPDLKHSASERWAWAS